MIIFIHIPKTAGSSFDKLAKLQYPYSQVFNFRTHILKYDYELFISLPDEVKSTFKYVRGHIPFSIQNNISNDFRPNFVTILRQPVQRMLSQYYYSRNRIIENNNLSSLTLEGFLENYYTDNIQVRMLCGSDDFKIVFGGKPVTQEHLKMAKANLIENFNFGLTEYFDESIALLQKDLKWDIRSYPFERRTKNKKGNLSQGEYDQIRKVDQLDGELYDFAQDIFFMRVRKLDEREFGRRLKRIKKLKKKNFLLSSLKKLIRV